METPETICTEVARLAKAELVEVFSPVEAWSFCRRILESFSGDSREGLDDAGIILELQNCYEEARFFSAFSLQFTCSDEDGEYAGMSMVTIGFEYASAIKPEEPPTDGWLQGRDFQKLFDHIESSLIYDSIINVEDPINRTIDGFTV